MTKIPQKPKNYQNTQKIQKNDQNTSKNQKNDQNTLET